MYMLKYETFDPRVTSKRDKHFKLLKLSILKKRHQTELMRHHV